MDLSAEGLIMTVLSTWDHNPMKDRGRDLCFRVICPKCAATKRTRSPPHTHWDIKLFDVPRPPQHLSLFPFRPATLSSFLLHSLSLSASLGLFSPFWTPHPGTKSGEWLLCSQVFSSAAPGPNSPGLHPAAALPSLPLCGSIVPPPCPRWFLGHTGEALFRPRRGVCVPVNVDYACLGETVCCRHLPKATPLFLPLASAPHCKAAALWLVGNQPL